MQLPFTLQYFVALDLGTAWTRGASQDGRLAVMESERHGLRGMAAGAVADAGTCAQIVSSLFRTLRPGFLGRPHAVAPVSACATPAQRAAILSTLYRSGAFSVTLLQQPLAAAVGAGLDPGSDYAQMIMDVGEGYTELAVIRAGRVETAEVIRAGCGDVRRILARHGTPREIWERLRWMEQNLFENNTGLLPQETVDALGELLDTLARGAAAFFRRLPDRTACEVIENGLLLVGGGAMLRELRRRISLQTRLAVRVPDQPLNAVIEGARQAIPYAVRFSC